MTSSIVERCGRRARLFRSSAGQAALLSGRTATRHLRSPAGLLAALFIALAAVAQPGPVPAPLQPYVDKVLKGDARNRVLHEMELGVAALAHDEIDLARLAFDNAVGQIEITHGGTEQAQKARSLWYEEGTKDFKGEPYERAMAYYYRGLIYLRDRDPDNARACFNSAILQDAFAEEHQNRCDFAVLYLMTAYACHLQDDTTARDEEFAKFTALRPDFAAPDWANSLLAIAESGQSPRKLADGVGHFQMKLFRGKGVLDVKTEFAAGAQKWAGYPAEDIAFQAMTRGSRPIDKILEGKVQFRQKADAFGTTLTSVSSEVMVAAPLFGQSSNVTAVAGGIGLIGVASQFIAQNARPRADTRYWSSLPDTVHVAFLPKDIRGQRVAASFIDPDGKVLATQERASGPDHTFLWFKHAQ